jgi:hypothetical protein
MESATKKNDFNSTIDLKINKEFLGIEELSKFKIELDNLGINCEKNKNPNYLLVQLPVSLIFYVEYLNKEIKFHLCSSELILTDNSNKSLVKISENINQKVDRRDIWSNFIRIKSYYLVRKGDIKGYDNNEKKVLLSSISHNKKIAKISVSSFYKRELFENIRFISERFLLVKSIYNIEYIVNLIDIICVESHTKSKKIFLKNNLHSNFIEIKLAIASNNIKNFFKDDFKILLHNGMFIQFNRSMIFNLKYFDENLLKGRTYNDPVCGEIEVEKGLLKKLNL